MGKIVFITLTRLAILIPVLWILLDSLDETLWWLIASFVIYFVVIFPAIQSYKAYDAKRRSLLTNTLCASCKHFDESALVCIKHDKHPEENFLPCEGLHWEPTSKGRDENKEKEI